MQEYLSELSPKLRFISKEVTGSIMRVYCESEIDGTKKVHSRVMRVIKDINYGKYKIELHILWKKYFNDNPNDIRKTVSESFEFIPHRGRRTKRLNDLLLSMQKEMSAIGCERLIKEGIADVSDSTILRLVKKTAESN